MGTPSLIGFVEEPGVVKAAYCHNNPQLYHNGKLLLENYKTAYIVEQLVGVGDMSYLDKFCNAPEDHSYDKPRPGHTVYYGRDRQEPNCSPQLYAEEECLATIEVPYVYLFKDGKWHVSTASDPEFRELTAEMVER